MARCNLRRLLCLPNQQFCLHCYCSHQTLQMYISDIMPPLQDRSHMAVLSSGWWSRVWIFYVTKVNSICSTLEGRVESWVYRDNDIDIIYAYQSHPRCSVDGLISQGGDLLRYHSRSSWTPGRHCSHVSPVLHSAFNTIRIKPSFFSPSLPPPPPPLHTIHLKASLQWDARRSFELREATQRVN